MELDEVEALDQDEREEHSLVQDKGDCSTPRMSHGVKQSPMEILDAGEYGGRGEEVRIECLEDP